MLGNDDLVGAQGQELFGSNMEQLVELNKALEAGSGIAVSGSSGGTALRVQSLEATLKTVTFTEQHARAWRMIPKKKANSVAEEYTTLNDYGEAGETFLPEIATPGVVDDTYERLVKQVRFLGVTKEVSLAALMSKTIGGSLEALQARNGTRQIIGSLEWNIFEASSEANPLAWDGIRKQVEDWVAANPSDSDCIVDLRGEPMTPEIFEDVCATVVQHYGQADHAFMPVHVYSDWSKQLMPEERFQLGTATNRFGLQVKEFQSQSGGMVQMHQCPLLNYARQCPTSALGNNAPTAPTVAQSAVADADSQLTADTYTYRVIARGQNGTSAPSTAVSQAIVVGQSARLVITEPSGAITFDIYRATAGDTRLFYLTTVACSGTGTTTYDDDGEWIAGTSRAYVGDIDQDQVIAFHRLSDLVKMDLAQLGTAKRFMLLMYGVPIVYIPRRWVVLKNIGRYVAP